MRKLSIAILAILAIVVGTGIIYYFKQGAFKDPVMKVTTSPEYVIAGIPYKGKMSSKEFGKLFNDAEKLIEDKKMRGTVCGIFYNKPEDGAEVQEAFVGVIMNDTTQTLPQGYSKRRLPSRKVLEAKVDNIYGSPLIYPKIDDYAEENKIKLKHVPALEVYPPTKEVYVQVPIE